jgi:hypothetical protein
MKLNVNLTCLIANCNFSKGVEDIENIEDGDDKVNYHTNVP